MRIQKAKKSSTTVDLYDQNEFRGKRGTHNVLYIIALILNLSSSSSKMAAQDSRHMSDTLELVVDDKLRDKLDKAEHVNRLRESGDDERVPSSVGPNGEFHSMFWGFAYS